MKYNELYKKLRRAGCLLLRHGRSHDIWLNPKSGLRAEVPRHGSSEVPKGTVQKIFKELGL